MPFFRGPQPDPAVTLVDPPREAPSSDEPVATLVDPHLGALIAQALVEREVPAAPHTMPMLDAPPRAPAADADATEMMLAIPDAPPSGWGLATETAEHEAVRSGETTARRPALVAHVFAPRRDYTLPLAFLAWSLVVAVAVYLVTAHNAARLDAQPRASVAAPAASAPAAPSTGASTPSALAPR